MSKEPEALPNDKGRPWGRPFTLYDNDIACWAEVRSRGLLRRVRLLSDLAEALQNGLNEERRRR